MRLVKASPDPPDGLDEFLRELGEGERGFGGTPHAADAQSLGDFLTRLVAMSEGRGLRPEQVPMTTHWLLNDEGRIVGMSRLRHRLNEALLQKGGHIGYYIRPSERGKGHGSEILRLSLREASQIGIPRALVTTDSDNHASIRVIEGNAGVLEDERVDDAGVPYRRYWIDLSGQQ
jgi:predicted acetyltransferase